MTIKVERKEKPKHLSPRPRKRGLLSRIGFTNVLALLIMLFLATGLAGGFYLALESIRTGYTGALMCWTVVFTPIGTACSIVLSKIVAKSEAENKGPNGEGIKYAAAAASNFQKIEDQGDVSNSPPI